MPLALVNSPAPAPDARWMSSLEVASRLGMSERHVRRLCAERWSARGLARRSGDAWEVSTHADERLRESAGWPLRDAEQSASLVASGVRPAYITRAELRRQVVLDWRAFDAPGLSGGARTDGFIARLRADGRVGPQAEIRRLSPSTLYAWAKAYDANGLRGLLPGYGDGDGSDPIGPAAWEYVRTLLLAGNRIRVAAAYHMCLGHIRLHALGDDPEWRLPALRTVQRIAKARISQPLRVLANEGERRFDAQCVPKAARNYDEIAAHETWIGDERTLDVMVRVPSARGWRATRQIKLTAWIDERSRLIVGWVLRPYANHETILAALKMGIARHGKPTRLRVDWGRDYRKVAGAHLRWKLSAWDGQRVGSILDRLGITVTPARPFAPWQKMIERWFGMMAEHFDKLIESYWGSRPDQRHQDRAAWVRANVYLLPTLDEVAAMLAQHIDAHHNSPHTGSGMNRMTPLAAAEAFRAGPPRRVSDELLEFGFLSFSEPRTVRRDGVRHLHAWYGWGDPRVIEMQGQKVVLGLPPDDAGRAWVCTHEEQPRPLFEVVGERHVGRSRRDAERVARGRASALRVFGEEVARPREAFEATPPADRLRALAAGRTVDGPRLLPAPADAEPGTIQVDPAVTAAVRAARQRRPGQGPLAGDDPGEITLADMLDSGGDAVGDVDDPGGDVDDAAADAGDWYGTDEEVADEPPDDEPPADAAADDDDPLTDEVLDD